LARVANQLTESGINIKSVVTSQTCISLLLAHRDLDAGHHALKSLQPKPYRQLEKIEGVALYFLVRNQDLHSTVNAIHSTFFSE